MGTLSDLIAQKKRLLCSGAWATELRRVYPSLNACVETLNASRPEQVRRLCETYAEISVDLLCTNTFAANRFLLARYGMAQHTASINLAGAQLAHTALRNDMVVCGLIGPIAVHMPKWNESLLLDAYRQQGQALHRGGAQVLWLETMLDVREAYLAVSALKDATPCDVVCTFTMRRENLGFTSHCGMFAQDALREVAKAGPDALGFNCGYSPQDSTTLHPLTQTPALRGIPMAFKPNTGTPDWEGSPPYSPQQFALQMRHALDKGFSIIGGCCGAGPEHIRALAKLHRK